MTAKELKTTTLLAGGAAALPHAQAADAVNDLIGRIQSADDQIRGPAWQSAGPAGAAAVKPLAALLTDANFEVARSAKRALYKIIRHADRPGATAEAKAVETELIGLLKSDALPARREALWMLSEIGSDRSIAPLAALLTDQEVREDARCALLRFPGAQATTALKSAFAHAPQEFKFALAESLRQRGEKVAGYPSQRLVPTKQTRVGRPQTN
jgi:HEAT repeat protein